MNIRKKVMFFKDDDYSWFDHIREPIQRIICFVAEHEPTPDQCNKPEHDFCIWCMKSLPNSVKRDEDGRPTRKKV